MPTPTNPSEIAREAFRLLASRRLPPSPENYRALYHEIAGTPAGAAAPFPERELKALLSALPKEKPAQERLLKRFEQAFKGKTWDELKRGLGEFFAQLGKEQDLPWSELFGDFLRQWESKQAGLTVARKREAVERVLAGAAGNSERVAHDPVNGEDHQQFGDDEWHQTGPIEAEPAGQDAAQRFHRENLGRFAFELHFPAGGNIDPYDIR